MKVKIFQFNPISENTYIAYDDTRECVIIDPGCFFPEEKKTLIDFIENNELIVKHLINTHLHFDHIFGCNFVEERFGMKTKAHRADESLTKNLKEQLQMFGFSGNESLPPCLQYIDEGDIVEFGNQKLSMLHLPGHSPGSLVFYNEEADSLFVGDVLFRGSIGRTDLEGGNHQQLISGIKTKLLTLPHRTIIYSGHGPSTSIGDEIQTNPFLQ